METGFQFVPKMFSMTFLSGFCPQTISPATVNTPLNSIVLSPLEVESVLKTLPAAKASGPNGLSNRLLRELSKELSTPYCSLFNQSLREGKVPSLYKEANVCPIPKKRRPI